MVSEPSYLKITAVAYMKPLNVIRFTTVIHRAIGSGLFIWVLELKFLAKEVGFPEGYKSADVLPDTAYRRNFFTAIDMLQNQAEKLLAKIKPKPNCIISDKHIAWTTETADKFQIPRIIFDRTSCFNQLCMHSLYIMKDQNKISESGPFVIPDLPNRIKVTKVQLPSTFNPSPTLLNRVSFDKENYLKKYFYSCQPESIVYACFRSISHTKVEQFVELYLGLEAIENGFEERTKERGLLIRGWAPQVIILKRRKIPKN
ncbi:hypothetical protein FXO38_36184 [Capsicum annuum]|uniref:Uncharacterized protein n=1 Tax=Capsicum annuum TaxID=4072 RepID=A0A2G2YWG7_CAPAN|nr:hypothetical protein FXO38_36184 [Capsicum annuum]KAF3613578.1 hypothetical protein FXO37_36326 [Capsicum annuum]PHT74053.1 hypothetical protein T459_21330 [Capsicum annuum]